MDLSSPQTVTLSGVKTFNSYISQNIQNAPGQNNVAIGLNAFKAGAGTGSNNTCLGVLAGSNCIEANGTTYIGYTAGFNATGNNNTCVGAYAYNNYLTVSGICNAALGTYSLAQNTSGSYNTAMGYNALPSNTTGSLNSGLGMISGNNCQTSSHCTFIGYNSGQDNPGNTYLYSCAIGYSSQITENNQIVIGGNVNGVYSSTYIPGTLTVRNNIYYGNISVTNSTISTTNGLNNITNSNYNYCLFTSNDTFKISNVSIPLTFYYVVVGGGGGGGGGSSSATGSNPVSGGGGGAGNVVTGNFTVSSLTTVTITVGTGGTAGAVAASVGGSGGAGVKGGNTIISYGTTTILAVGGNGGIGGIGTTNGRGGTGGSSGSGAAGGGGTTNATGTAGTYSNNSGSGAGGAVNSSATVLGGQGTLTLQDGTTANVAWGGNIAPKTQRGGTYDYFGSGGASGVGLGAVTGVGDAGKNGCVLIYWATSQNIQTSGSYSSIPDSTSTTTGALVVFGGAGIGGNLNVGIQVSGSTVLATSNTPSTSTGTGALIVTGGAGISGNLNVGLQVSASSFNATSDARFKTDIADLLDNPEYSVDGLRPVSYFNTILGKPDIGFIAQEVEQVYPFMVNENAEGYKSMNYISIIGILVKEIQMLKQVIRGTGTGDYSGKHRVPVASPPNPLIHLTQPGESR
jgi:hypothetical protein